VALPWRTPGHERVLLALVAVAALLPFYAVTAQDQSRLCLTDALLHGRLSNDACLARSVDKARYGRHLYSDKAPGLSVLELPSAAAVRLPPVRRDGGHSVRVWAVRVLSSGLAFLAAAFLVGRVAEGLERGAGGRALVAFGLGTLVAPLAAANFGHGAAGAAGFGAFLLAWRRRFVLAGLLAGLAPLIDYPAAAITVVLASYAARHGRRALAAFAAAVVPSAALLGVYDALAFGSPFHLSYRYVVGSYASEQASGFFGVGVPRAHSVYEVLVGNRGLLVASPVVVAAAFGLVVLARTHRAEALVCAAVALFFLVLEFGYFLPYGGGSPGPRFLVPALPFLAVGLGPAFARAPRATTVLALVSVVATTALTLVWLGADHLDGTIWGELAGALDQGRWSHFARSATETILAPLGVSRGPWVVAFAAAAAAAVAFGAPLVAALRRRPPVAAVAAGVAAAAAVGAFRLATLPPALHTGIQSTESIARTGDQVHFTVTLRNAMHLELTHVRLNVALPQGMVLLASPYYERGSGCTGTTRITCNLDFLEAGMRTVVRFGVRIGPLSTDHVTVRAWGSADGAAGPGAATSLVVSA